MRFQANFRRVTYSGGEDKFMLRRAFCIAAILVSSCASFISSALAQSGGYSVIKKISIPGEGSFDYLTVDAAARRLYVSHGTQVEVVDIDALTVVGNVPKTPGVHGIAIAPELGRGFVHPGIIGQSMVRTLSTAIAPLASAET